MEWENVAGMPWRCQSKPMALGDSFDFRASSPTEDGQGTSDLVFAAARSGPAARGEAHICTMSFTYEINH